MQERGWEKQGDWIVVKKSTLARNSSFLPGILVGPRSDVTWGRFGQSRAVPNLSPN